MFRNYSNELEKILEDLKKNNIIKSLLLHSCCAPCSSYVLSYLSDYFNITVLYYNPNISPSFEYFLRKSEQKRLLEQMNFKNKVSFIDCDYNPREFFDLVKGFENEKEGGKRCDICYRLRLEKTAMLAKENMMDCFATTLTVSPYKNADKLNQIGEALSEKYSVPYLVSDFKKKNGYKLSIELSRKYNLYRQNFCGCVFSKNK